MREMEIYGVSFDLVGKQPIVLLKTAEGNKFLPIWIGHPEAAAILVSMYGARLEDAPQLARERVWGGTATPDGQLWLTEYAQREVDRLGIAHAFGDLEIVSVERIEKARAA